MATVQVSSVNGSNTGSIYSIAGVKTAYPGVTQLETGFVDGGLNPPTEEYRSFLHFPTAGVVPAGNVVTKVELQVKLWASLTKTVGTNYALWYMFGQPFIESTLATSDWDQGTLIYEGGTLTTLDTVTIMDAFTLQGNPFDITADFDLAIWDKSTHATDSNFDTYIGFWNGNIPSRKQVLTLTYSKPGSQPGKGRVAYTFGG